MLLNAKKNKATATKMAPEGPISLVSACWVSCTPFVEPSSGAPLNRMMKAVHCMQTSQKMQTLSWKTVTRQQELALVRLLWKSKKL